MHMKSGLFLVAAAMLATSAVGQIGQKGQSPPPDLGDPTSTEWRRAATAADRERLRVWRDSWIVAIKKARAAGNGPAISAEGVLFEPDLALADPMPPTGTYRCRVFKLGAKGTAAHDFTAFPSQECRVEAINGGMMRIYQVSGAQKLVGRGYSDGTARAVFLGTLVLGDEKIAKKYGSDTHRNMAGIIQRVADKRWRIALPKPAFESMLDVVELVPA